MSLLSRSKTPLGLLHKSTQTVQYMHRHNLFLTQVHIYIYSMYECICTCFPVTFFLERRKIRASVLYINQEDATLQYFPGPLLVSTLALWNFESLCVSFSFLGWGVGGVRYYKKKKKKKKHRHLFLVILLPCVSAASPAVSYPLLCSSLLKCLSSPL